MDKKLPYLDRLRALAVIGVLIVHTAQFSFANLNLVGGAEQAILTILYAGRFGVEVFFLLSGFLLSYLYESGRVNRSNKQYFLARFLRIWPLWILFTITWAVIYSISPGSKSSGFDWIALGVLLSTFFLLWVSPLHFENFIGGAWSIQIEVACYLIFAWMRGKSVRTVLYAAIIVNCVGLTLSFIADLEGSSVLDALRRLSLQTGFNFFVLGWLLARVYSHHKRPRNTLSSPETNATRESLNHVFAGQELMLAIWLASFVLTPAIYGNPIEAVGFVLMAVVIAQITGRSTYVSRLLEKTGKLSYFIFFMHFVILHFVNMAIPVDARPEALWAVLALNFLTLTVVFLACFFLALASFRFFEGPLLALSRKA